jgi:peroxiredoxin
MSGFTSPVRPDKKKSSLTEKEVAMAMPNVGDKAPDFSLPVSREQKVGLRDFLGKKNVVLAFYPLDFTGG